MSSNKPSKLVKWLKSPLLYLPLIAIGVYLTFFRPYSNNIVKGNKTNLYCTTAEPQATQLRLICWISDDILVEDAAGNRYTIEPESLNCTDSIVLKTFNSEYEFYVKMESPQTLFRGMTIDDVVGKVGDYVYGDVERGEYSYPYVVAVQGKTRHYGVTVFVGGDGRVESIELGERTSSNWFGALPFYPEIVSLNMLTATSTPILHNPPETGKSRGFFGWLLYAAWNIIKFFLLIALYFLYVFVVFAIPLCVLFPILRLFTFIKSVPNRFITIVVWTIGLALVYIITISQVEGTRSIWLITLPINLFVGIWTIILFYKAVDEGRCPQCHHNKALFKTRELTGVHNCIEERDHAKKGNRRYIRETEEHKVYDYDREYWTTRRRVVTNTYLVTEACKYCGYKHQYSTTETEKGESVVIDRWMDTRRVHQKKDKIPVLSSTENENIIRDDRGVEYYRCDQFSKGVDGVYFRGEYYKKK